MPFIRVTHNAQIAPGTEDAIAAGLATLMQDILRKKRDLTSVLVESVPQGRWSVGNARPPVAAHLEVTITAGTNTGEEKADFIRQAMALLGSHFGTLPEATYAIIRDIPATDWGYDGRTQASRRVMAS